MVVRGSSWRTVRLSLISVEQSSVSNGVPEAGDGVLQTSREVEGTDASASWTGSSDSLSTDVGMVVRIEE
jgi:hypothetical protein